MVYIPAGAIAKGASALEKLKKLVQGERAPDFKKPLPKAMLEAPVGEVLGKIDRIKGTQSTTAVKVKGPGGSTRDWKGTQGVSPIEAKVAKKAAEASAAAKAQIKDIEQQGKDASAIRLDKKDQRDKLRKEY